ncbi:hypothetical protein BHM03_00018659 [Ensete ventricosum]|nr:hypothetical protein BHM03_00018659 [Ensete ventricosum]
MAADLERKAEELPKEKKDVEMPLVVAVCSWKNRRRRGGRLEQPEDAAAGEEEEVAQLPTAGSAQAESCKLPGSGCTELGSVRPPWPPAQAAVLPPTRAAAAAGLGAKAGYFRSCRWWSSNLEKEKDDCD